MRLRRSDIGVERSHQTHQGFERGPHPGVRIICIGLGRADGGLLQSKGRRFDRGDLKYRGTASNFVGAKLQILENPSRTFLGTRKRGAERRKMYAVAL